MKKSKLLGWATAIFCIANIIYYCFADDEGYLFTVISDSLPIICSLIAVIGLYGATRGFKKFDVAKLAWSALLVGMGFYFIAESIYGVLEVFFNVDMSETFPTIADLFWVFAYIPFFIGLVVLINQYRQSNFPMGTAKFYFALTIIFVVLAGLLIKVLFNPIIADEETSALAKFVYIFYPSGDLFLVIPALILIHITTLLGKGSLSRPWRFIALGFFCITVADIFYAYSDWMGEYQAAGSFIDVGWNVGYLLLAIGGVCQRELVDSLKKVRGQ